MGILIIILGISLFIGWWSYVWTEHSGISVKKDNAFCGIMISGVILSIISLFVVAASYGSYVECRTMYESTIGQYKQAVTMYTDSAEINVESAAMTDFKYNGYQENVADFIKGLRSKVVEYNEMLISKRIMNSNFIFSWLVIGPDEDMKVLRLSDEN